MRAARGRGRGRGRKYRWTTTQRSRSRARGGRAARGGRLTVGHVVCSRRAPVADATPHYHRLHRTDGQQEGDVRIGRTPDVRRRCQIQARRPRKAGMLGVGQIYDTCIYSCSFQIHCIYRIQCPKPNTVNTYLTSRIDQVFAKLLRVCSCEGWGQVAKSPV